MCVCVCPFRNRRGINFVKDISNNNNIQSLNIELPIGRFKIFILHTNVKLPGDRRVIYDFYMVTLPLQDLANQRFVSVPTIPLYLTIPSPVSYTHLPLFLCHCHCPSFGPIHDHWLNNSFVGTNLGCSTYVFTRKYSL